MQDWHPSLSFKKQLNHCLIHITQTAMYTSPSRGKKRCLTKADNAQNSHIHSFVQFFFSQTANGAKDQLLPFTHREDKQAFS